MGNDFFHKLSSVKFDQKIAIELGLTGIFNRDYKNYFFKRGPETGGVIGLSVSVVTPHKLFESFGE